MKMLDGPLKEELLTLRVFKLRVRASLMGSEHDVVRWAAAKLADVRELLG
jgi:hypothetical protein